ncbi:unnamed protein product [Lactuca saligna]|uniref:Exocyst subunit Exo70 family protein n=1 Tax=Lactuca saligna TaxID=75948 RepID=A0AA35ZL31_LACSI|nr:unnamed protein product [Lactuca saligna]
MSSIREIDLIPSDVVCDLRSIAERMIAADYFQYYFQRMEWEALNTKIGTRMCATKMCVRVLFAREKRLFEHIFEGLGTATNDACFMETVKGLAVQLFNFVEAITISRCAPEKLFKILDLHDTFYDLLPDINTVFDGKSAESIRVQVMEILSRLAEAARGMINEFENAVVRVPVTLNGDLKNQFVEPNVGFGTVCKQHALSADIIIHLYYYFVRLMGQKASHVALECTLQSHLNMENQHKSRQYRLHLNFKKISTKEETVNHPPNSVIKADWVKLYQKFASEEFQNELLNEVG